MEANSLQKEMLKDTVYEQLMREAYERDKKKKTLSDFAGEKFGSVCFLLSIPFSKHTGTKF